MTTVAEMIEFLSQFPPETSVEVVKAYEGTGWYGEGGGGRAIEFEIEPVNFEGATYTEYFVYEPAHPGASYAWGEVKPRGAVLMLGKES